MRYGHGKTAEAVSAYGSTKKWTRSWPGAWRQTWARFQANGSGRSSGASGELRQGITRASSGGDLRAPLGQDGQLNAALEQAAHQPEAVRPQPLSG